MNIPPSQILLTSTSSMSLDERFTMMRNQQVPLTDISDSVSQHLTASLKNQRLAQQMASRPSVLAALQNNLSLKQEQFKGSVKARLGGPIVRGGLRDISKYRGRTIGRGVLLRGAWSHRRRGMQFVHRGLAGKTARTESLPTREELDAQLDDYMSMTKSYLDAQLDAYMAEVDSEDLL